MELEKHVIICNIRKVQLQLEGLRLLVNPVVLGGVQDFPVTLSLTTN